MNDIYKKIRKSKESEDILPLDLNIEVSLKFYFNSFYFSIFAFFETFSVPQRVFQRQDL